MSSEMIGKAGRVVVLLAVFASGYVAGTIGSRSAEAQLGDLGGQALKQAAGSGGLGSVGQMGTTLVEMEQHVSGLQKNLDALKKVKAALGG